MDNLKKNDRFVAEISHFENLNEFFLKKVLLLYFTAVKNGPKDITTQFRSSIINSTVGILVLNGHKLINFALFSYKFTFFIQL